MSVPPEPPTYFTDRDLGHVVPDHLEAAGYETERHDDHFGQHTTDIEWISEAGRRGWVVISKDKGIARNPSEKQAVKEGGVAMFLLVGRKATHPELARNLVNTMQKVEAFLQQHDPPFIARVYRPSPVSGVAQGKPGRVEMWLDFQ